MVRRFRSLSVRRFANNDLDLAPIGRGHLSQIVSASRNRNNVDDSENPPPQVINPIRQASLFTDTAIHSGHSLTDSYINGTLRDVFIECFDGVLYDQHRKSTIPGSSTWVRWESADGLELNPKDHMDQFNLLMITERGLDNVGVAPITHEVFLEDILYELKYANRVAAENKEMVLWSIWPSHTWANWQDTLADYEVRFKIRKEYLEWKMKQLRPEWNKTIWICPGHRLVQRMLTELPPGVANFEDLFRDDIHPNTMFEYGLGLFVLTFMYQIDLRTIDSDFIPTVLVGQDRVPAATPEQAAFFKRVAWEVLTDYADAGMGGTSGAEGHWDQYDWYPSVTTPAELEAATVEDGVAWQPPPAEPIAPQEVSGYVTSIPTIEATGVPMPLTSLDTPIPAGDFYGLMVVTPDETQTSNASIMFTLRNGGTNIASLNLRTDLDALLFENDPSGGGNHVSANQSVLSGDLIIEFWIGKDGGFLTINGKQYSSAGMTTANVDAISYRVGEGGWGPEPFSGTIHSVSLFSGKPTDEERAGLRAWAATTV